MMANPKKNTIITVTVDLHVLREEGDDHCNKCDQATTFTDNRDDCQTGSGNGKNHTSCVNLGKRVIWVGDLENSESENDFIDILAVAKKIPQELSLLEQDFYLGHHGVVEAKVLNSSNVGEVQTNAANNENDETEMAYSISYLVGFEYDNKMHYEICTIDPKIRMSI